MTLPAHGSPARGLGSLRRFLTPQEVVERCELCAAAIGAQHEHLVDPTSRRLLCSCQACAILFDDSGMTKYRRVPRDARELAGFDISDVFWNGLSIPIGMVFLFRSSASGSVAAVYPSAAGPTEARIEDDVWRELSALHPSIAGLLEDVEALLINRTKGSRDYFITPIDQCYRLTGIIRRHWEGFSGGDEVWEQIGSFFAELRQRSRAEGIASHA
jgi:hypothetical protein